MDERLFEKLKDIEEQLRGIDTDIVDILSKMKNASEFKLISATDVGVDWVIKKGMPEYGMIVKAIDNRIQRAMTGANQESVEESAEAEDFQIKLIKVKDALTNVELKIAELKKHMSEEGMVGGEFNELVNKLDKLNGELQAYGTAFDVLDDTVKMTIDNTVGQTEEEFVENEDQLFARGQNNDNDAKEI